jgi:cardiolipin synthase A/B
MSYNPGLVTDHTKVFIFDEQEAYLGGMNIGREYATDRHDMMVRVTGPVVKIHLYQSHHCRRLGLRRISQF